MVGDRVLDLHLVEEDHVGAAQIGGARRHALAALGAGGEEVDHAWLVMTGRCTAAFSSAMVTASPRAAGKRASSRCSRCKP